MGNNPVRNMPENPQDEIFQVIEHKILYRFMKSSFSCLWITDCAAVRQVKIFNAGNTCYLDSVLFAMFAVPSPAFEQLLTKR